ncbi:hypothetical protein H6B11_12555 [Mediterraneibacter glycyrrhizinilyticus]|nr:hypothetical protein [Mediterraneibacter glycyrrhizinilyticus]MBM6854972.1 hypothetical protein [Mediterraneibacter glycyrrhizinilyticus]
MDECTAQGILDDILTSQEAEVIQVVLETFDQEKYDLTEAEILEKLQKYRP